MNYQLFQDVIGRLLCIEVRLGFLQGVAPQGVSAPLYSYGKP